MKKILTLGSATQDIFVEYEDKGKIEINSKKKKTSFLILEEGIKVDVPKLYYSTGGGATNSAVSLERLGLNVSSCFKIGKDTPGSFILEELKKTKIDLDNVIISDKHNTAISFILPTLEKNYTALCYRGANKLIELNEMPLESLKSFDYLYISSLSGLSAQNLYAFVKKAMKYNIYIATNPGTYQLTTFTESIKDSLPYLNILILNAFEAEICLRSILKIEPLIPCPPAKIPKTERKPFPELFEKFIFYHEKKITIYDFFYHILQKGPEIVVVTNGAQGVYLGTKDYVLFHPSIKADLVNTIGAGDAFGSCFVGSLVRGHKIEEALILGIINSSSVVSYLDTKEGLLPYKELIKQYKKIGKKKLLQQPIKK